MTEFEKQAVLDDINWLITKVRYWLLDHSSKLIIDALNDKKIEVQKGEVE